jgi:ubiquinone/menaquinone biosynthesis C-methylase UbiE
MKKSVKVKSKAWDWDKNENNYWEVPAEEVVPIVFKWKKIGFKKVLDLGCGLGRHSILLAANGFSVEAFDLSQEALEKFRDKIKNRNLKIKLKFGDMLDLPYKENTFDCLLAFHAIQHTDLKGLRKVVENIYRTLKPGGEAYVTLLSKKDYSWKKFAKRRIDDHTLLRTENAEIDVPHTYLDYEEVKILFRKFKMQRCWQIFKYMPRFAYAHFYLVIKK